MRHGVPKSYPCLASGCAGNGVSALGPSWSPPTSLAHAGEAVGAIWGWGKSPPTNMIRHLRVLDRKVGLGVSRIWAARNPIRSAYIGSPAGSVECGSGSSNLGLRRNEGGACMPGSRAWRNSP